MSLVRGVDGRFLGKDNQFHNFESESYRDFKESNLRFPEHKQGSGEVHTWIMSREELAAKFGK